MERLLLRVSEAAEMLGISRTKCYEMIAAFELPVIRVVEFTRVPLADLQAWIEEQKEAARPCRHGVALSVEVDLERVRPQLLRGL